MTTLAQRIEEKTNRSISDIADDTAQGIALTGIFVVLVAWVVMLLQTL